ncbi:DUF91 domain-containing protein [Rhizobium sp. NLR4b]|uniref:DUF5655 domain-containing protein n=1 Tax=unclassified Rhizobium TaxID=2613769 RepID=UPI001C82F641|nr:MULTISPECIES: DUF5655 domain-containing protein [unclassified Rhizobium]MBX5254870.1 DUF91 domain-containing protein [Rhizobium sp. NLR4b]MBX5303641.1 DUF91 domain-containing protein [Rhizobium sp. NLR12b]
MSDIKLFHFGSAQVSELPGSAVQVEKSLQVLFEGNLEALLGIRFLASEHSTGPVHGGRIDTLGLDEDNSPVIIEYKRAINENVINQGLFYLDWLLDHRREFQWLVMERYGAEAATAVDWSAPRLLCIAGDFTRYDEHAVKQIARNIELIRYRRFGQDLLMMELVHAPKTARVVTPEVRKSAAPESSTKEEVDEADPYWRNRMAYRLSQASAELRDIYDGVQQFLVGLGDDVQVKELQQYTGFKRIKNFVCLQIYPQDRSVVAYLKLDPSTVDLDDGFSRDVRGIGHHGTGDLKLLLKSMADFERAQPLLRRAYEGG